MMRIYSVAQDGQEKLEWRIHDSGINVQRSIDCATLQSEVMECEIVDARVKLVPGRPSRR